MSLPAAARASRSLARAVRTCRAPCPALSRASYGTRVAASQHGLVAQRLFGSSTRKLKGIMPHTENPAKSDVAKTEHSYGVVELSEAEYHELSDLYLDTVLEKFEHLQDTREDIDIEYSAGVMTITIAGKDIYVLNKQPPNKQIWLSSPISGPKRYDWCIIGEGQGEKEGTGSGNWIYMRDGTSLNDLIFKELEIVIDVPTES
ncbi:hypothetical protein HIM_00123 [Hirsutella minnesotensis 3608]|nr:hypothetical protein HIM_00123 [Hirsutella minnesotensis 3608]